MTKLTKWHDDPGLAKTGAPVHIGDGQVVVVRPLHNQSFQNRYQALTKPHKFAIEHGGEKGAEVDRDCQIRAMPGHLLMTWWTTVEAETGEPTFAPIDYQFNGRGWEMPEEHREKYRMVPGLIDDADDEPLPPTPENMVELLREAPRFFTAVVQGARDSSTFRAEVEDASGN